MKSRSGSSESGLMRQNVKGNSQAGRWLGWSIIAGAGILMTIGGYFVSQNYVNGLSRASMVVSGMQVDAQAMASEALLITKGNPSALDNVKARRLELGKGMTLLEAGGRFSAEDSSSVLALSSYGHIPLQEVKQGLASFDESFKTIEESASQLRRAAEAETALQESLSDIEKVLQNIGRMSSLTSGSWGAALNPTRATLSRDEMKTMSVIFAPLGGAQSLQAAWANQFAQIAKRTEYLESASKNDRSLSETQRNQVKLLNSAVVKLAGATDALAQTLPVRLEAKKMEAPILASASSLQSPLGKVGGAVIKMQSERPLSVYVLWIGLLMAVVGLIGMVMVSMSLGQEHWSATQESKAGHGLVDAVERINRQIKRMIGKGGVLVPNAKVDDDVDILLSPLVGNINKIMDGQNNYVSNVNKSMEQIASGLNGLSTPVAKMVSSSGRIQESCSRSSAIAKDLAGNLASLASQDGVSKVSDALEMIESVDLLMDEGGFKMDAMRERTQEVSKRLKRLAEGAQKIALSSDSIEGLSRKIKVLSTNTAIAAAAHGEEGRKFAAIAKEVERLSQSVQGAASDIASAVKEIQGDAQETMSTMEVSTSEVVASSQLSAKASASLRNVEGLLSEHVKTVEAMNRVIAKQALDGDKLRLSCDDIAQVASGLKSVAESSSDEIDKNKSLCKMFKKDLRGDSSS